MGINWEKAIETKNRRRRGIAKENRMDLEDTTYEYLTKRLGELRNKHRSRFDINEKEEYRAIVDRMIEFENTVTNTGYLNKDLYFLKDITISESLCTEDEMNELTNDFISSFVKYEKGTKFKRFGDGRWTDDCDILCHHRDLDDKWADKNIERIENV